MTDFPAWKNYVKPPRCSLLYWLCWKYIHLGAAINCLPEEDQSVSRNGVYKIYDHMHVAFPRIMPPNHTRESYHESYPWFQQGRAKHTPKHTPETYLRNIPRIIPPDATRFAGHGVFGKGLIKCYTISGVLFSFLGFLQIGEVGHVFCKSCAMDLYGCFCWFLMDWWSRQRLVIDHTNGSFSRWLRWCHLWYGWCRSDLFNQWSMLCSSLFQLQWNHHLR